MIPRLFSPLVVALVAMSLLPASASAAQSGANGPVRLVIDNSGRAVVSVAATRAGNAKLRALRSRTNAYTLSCFLLRKATFSDGRTGEDMTMTREVRVRMRAGAARSSFPIRLPRTARYQGCQLDSEEAATIALPSRGRLSGSPVIPVFTLGDSPLLMLAALASTGNPLTDVPASARSMVDRFSKINGTGITATCKDTGQLFVAHVLASPIALPPAGCTFGVWSNASRLVVSMVHIDTGKAERIVIGAPLPKA